MITHHSNYIRWMEEDRIDFLDGIGWSYARLEEMCIVSPVRAVACQYKAPTTFADDISISVRVEEFNGVVLKLAYAMVNQHEKLVFEGRSEHCFLNRDGRILRMKREYPELHDALCSLAEA